MLKQIKTLITNTNAGQVVWNEYNHFTFVTNPINSVKLSIGRYPQPESDDKFKFILQIIEESDNPHEDNVLEREIDSSGVPDLRFNLEKLWIAAKKSHVDHDSEAFGRFLDGITPKEPK